MGIELGNAPLEKPIEYWYDLMIKTGEKNHWEDFIKCLLKMVNEFKVICLLENKFRIQEIVKMCLTHENESLNNFLAQWFVHLEIRNMGRELHFSQISSPTFFDPHDNINIKRAQLGLTPLPVEKTKEPKPEKPKPKETPAAKELKDAFVGEVYLVWLANSEWWTGEFQILRLYKDSVKLKNLDGAVNTFKFEEIKEVDYMGVYRPLWKRICTLNFNKVLY